MRIASTHVHEGCGNVLLAKRLPIGSWERKRETHFERAVMKITSDRERRSVLINSNCSRAACDSATRLSYPKHSLFLIALDISFAVETRQCSKQMCVSDG